MANIKKLLKLLCVKNGEGQREEKFAESFEKLKNYSTLTAEEALDISSRTDIDIDVLKYIVELIKKKKWLDTLTEDQAKFKKRYYKRTILPAKDYKDYRKRLRKHYL